MQMGLCHVFRKGAGGVGMGVVGISDRGYDSDCMCKTKIAVNHHGQRLVPMAFRKDEFNMQL